MQVLLHADHNTDGRHQMAEHLEVVVTAALERFGERVTRVEAYLSDADSKTRTSADAIHCTIEARLVGLAAVVVKDHAGNAHQAIEGAVHKLTRAIGSAMSKHHPRGHGKQVDPPTADFDVGMTD